MAIILNANKVNLFVSSVLFVFWYHSQNYLDTPRMWYKGAVQSVYEAPMVSWFSLHGYDTAILHRH
jgi:hypothetical protein